MPIPFGGLFEVYGGIAISGIWTTILMFFEAPTLPNMLVFTNSSLGIVNMVLGIDTL